ncbi:TIGR00156 family protein [Duganella sp. CF517]|uniref:YgiW/YdeI family stress tolerance OB fold protein n=1 Tax=Duganella sp. CF517 TaxID=1881038 RepID=UPI0008BB935F|nr:NirD/YgiW/YdeI family stress tolerance protein [Duganella sp. CF517]SEO53542.1 TIGR00156 family protein [Duganella sp. CF517]
MKRIFQLSLVTALLAGSAFAVAQPGGYAGPSTNAAPAGYSGPSTVQLMTAKDLLAKGKDDQYVKLKGKLVNHKGGEEYEFADQSGKMTVEIDAKRFPDGAKIDQNTLVELTGEFDKETFGESTLDVKQIKVVTN